MDYEQFKVPVYELTQIDLNYYKERQMKRRIDALIEKHKIKGYEEFIDAIRNDKTLFEEFVNYITINVSEFFRNPEQWKILKEEIIPMILAGRKRKIRVWSAACSTGDEPYSMAMLLSEFMPLSDIRILATDIDNQVLEKARAGLYSAKSLANLPEKYLKQFFVKVGERNYQICKQIKQCVEFQHHNLLEDEYPKDYDLILCRNVVIYFTDEAKTQIYRKFNKSLNKDGILFVGSTEQIINYKELEFTSIKSFFYKKGILSH